MRIKPKKGDIYYRLNGQGRIIYYEILRVFKNKGTSYIIYKQEEPHYRTRSCTISRQLTLKQFNLKFFKKSPAMDLLYRSNNEN